LKTDYDNSVASLMKGDDCKLHGSVSGDIRGGTMPG
jgi:hypothetical protein